MSERIACVYNSSSVNTACHNHCIMKYEQGVKKKNNVKNVTKEKEAENRGWKLKERLKKPNKVGISENKQKYVIIEEK